MENKKQEAIRKAYEHRYDILKENINDNGECLMYSDNTKVSPNFQDLGFTREEVENTLDTFYDPEDNTHYWRPKILKGIENNNSWVSINSVDDLPKENTDCFIVIENYIHIAKFIIFDGDKMFEYGDKGIMHHDVTQYQPIIKPNLPIY